jgi:hypothetical protein
MRAASPASGRTLIVDPEFSQERVAMRKYLLGAGAAVLASASQAGVIWVPTSFGVPTMSEFALAALAVAVGVVAARFIKKK